MKSVFAIAAAVALLIPALAFAQQNNQHKGPAARPAPHAAPRPAARPAARPGARPGVAHGPARPGARPGVAHGPARPGVRPGVAHGPARPGRPGFAGRPGGYHPPRGNRFYHGGHYYGRVHGRPWAWPHGYGYHRWYVGGIFPSFFVNPTYYYADYAALGLAPPPPGYVWVRYGPDLVLVNISTYAVQDIAYGVFL